MAKDQFNKVTFEAVTVNCVGAGAPRFNSVVLLPQRQVSLQVSAPPGGSVTIQQSGDLVNWLPLTNLINANGTVEFTDTPATDVPQRFYRARTP